MLLPTSAAHWVEDHDSLLLTLIPNFTTCVTHASLSRIIEGGADRVGLKGLMAIGPDTRISGDISRSSILDTRNDAVLGAA